MRQLAPPKRVLRTRRVRSQECKSRHRLHNHQQGSRSNRVRHHPKPEYAAGIELAKRAVELKPGLKVVYSTGLPVTDDLKALLVPGSVILEKPYTVDQLLTSLSVHVGAGPRPHV